jgi:hypothetical protein
MLSEIKVSPTISANRPGRVSKAHPTPRSARKRGAARAASDFADRIDVGAMAAGGMLFGGDAGHRVHRAIHQRLRRLPKKGVLLVDFGGVRQASNQALKEALSVVDVLRTSKFEERYVVFRVDTRNRDLVDSIEMVARLGGDIIPVIDRAGRRHNFGKLTKAERDTLKAVERFEELTSRELREQLGLLPSAASNRLRRLHHLRLIRRDERVVPASGGREFVYRPLVAAAGVQQRKKAGAAARERGARRKR